MSLHPQPSGSLAATVALLLLLSFRPAAAQEQPGSWYLTGGATLGYQKGATGESSQTYLAAPGGASWGWSVGGGRFTSRRVGLEGELAVTGMMRAVERSRYGYTYHLERRDVFLGFNLRFTVAQAGQVRLEPVVGVGIALHRSWSQDDRFIPWGAPGGTVDHGPRRQYVTTDSFFVSAGLDLRLGGRRVAFVPSFRVRLNDSTEKLQSAWPAGYPHLTWSGGGSLRIAF